MVRKFCHDILQLSCLILFLRFGASVYPFSGFNACILHHLNFVHFSFREAFFLSPFLLFSLLWSDGLRLKHVTYPNFFLFDFFY